MSILEVENVSVRFGGLTAVDRVNLAVEEGTVMGVIGPNGAGKTTLFNVIAGIQAATYGEIFLGGEDVTRLGAHQRAAGRGLEPHLPTPGGLRHAQRPREPAPFAAESRRRWDRSVKPSVVVDDLIERLDLGSVATRTPTPSRPARNDWSSSLAPWGPRVVLLDEASVGRVDVRDRRHVDPAA